MDLETYCIELLRLNQTRLASFKDPYYFSSIVIGQVEELLELFCKCEASADNAVDLILELGDVLAYTVLTVAALRHGSVLGHVNLAKDVAAILNGILSITPEYDLSQHTTFVEVPLIAASKYKRWYRERQLVEIPSVFAYFQAAHAFLNNFLQSKMKLAPVSLEYVGQQNIQKLLGRVERQTMFVGEGDYR